MLFAFGLQNDSLPLLHKAHRHLLSESLAELKSLADLGPNRPETGQEQLETCQRKILPLRNPWKTLRTFVELDPKSSNPRVLVYKNTGLQCVPPADVHEDSSLPPVLPCADSSTLHSTVCWSDHWKRTAERALSCSSTATQEQTQSWRCGCVK